jgi:hypothetical protein
MMQIARLAGTAGVLIRGRLSVAECLEYNISPPICIALEIEKKTPKWRASCGIHRVNAAGEHNFSGRRSNRDAAVLLISPWDMLSLKLRKTQLSSPARSAQLLNLSPAAQAPMGNDVLVDESSECRRRAAG